MAWTSPMTAVTGNVLTAAQFNTYWRDNLTVSEGGIASTVGCLLVASGSNAFSQRIPTVDFSGAFDSTTSTTYTTLTDDPAVGVSTGQWALVSIGAQVKNDTAGLGSRVSFAVSGATTVAAADANSYYAESGNASDSYQGTWTTVYYPLTAGANLFALNYRTTAGGGTSTFGHRLVAVLPF